jgi:hypothetical protein
MTLQRAGTTRRIPPARGRATMVGASGCHRATPLADARIDTSWIPTLGARGRAQRVSPSVASRAVAYRAVLL